VDWLPTNSWLNEYLAPLFTKATEEHHFGTSEYMLLVALVGDLGIRHQTKPFLKKMKNHWFCQSAI
jgi:hypothetical protein